MARDYKPKRKPSGGLSGWMGLVCGLGVGLAIAGIVYVKDHRPEMPSAHAAKTDKKKELVVTTRAGYYAK